MMSVSIICIGTELLLGDTLNSNLAFLGRELLSLGNPITHERCIPDDSASISHTVQQLFSSSDILITVGGLGPTEDDCTREAIARALGLQLRYQADLAENIQQYWRSRNAKVPDSILSQAYVFEGALILPNEQGTAPGMYHEIKGRILLLLPGPPPELQFMFTTYALPRLQKRLTPVQEIRRFQLTGIPEPTVEAEVKRILSKFPMLQPAYCSSKYDTTVRLSTNIANKAELEQASFELEQHFKDKLCTNHTTILEQIVEQLRKKKWTLGTAESCTGGAIAKRITDLPGVSDIFSVAIISYSNAMKEKLLGVSADCLKHHGAVSLETTEAMLEGLIERYGLNVGIAVTGLAGPNGNAQTKSIGLVYISSFIHGKINSTENHFSGDRISIREQSVDAALRQFYQHLTSSP